MMHLCSEVLKALKGKTLATAESLTGGGIGQAITAVPGSSAVYKGGIVGYTDDVKHNLLGVSQQVLDQFGAVSQPVALEMAKGVLAATGADVAVSVTGLAGPDSDRFGNPVGTVFIGYADKEKTFARLFRFRGDRERVRNQTIEAALRLVLEENR